VGSAANDVPLLTQALGALGVNALKRISKFLDEPALLKTGKESDCLKLAEMVDSAIEKESRATLAESAKKQIQHILSFPPSVRVCYCRFCLPSPSTSHSMIVCFVFRSLW
jgi:hypothetical protein